MQARFLTKKQVCELTSLSRATVERKVASGDFPRPIRLTERRLVFNLEAVEQWIAARGAA